MTQPLIFRPLTIEGRAWFRANILGSYGRQSNVGLYPSTLGFSCLYHSTNDPYEFMYLLLKLNNFSHWMHREVGRFHHFLQATKTLRESRGIALLCFYTSVLEGGEGSASRSGRFLPLGKNRNPLYRRLGGPQGRSGRAEKLAPPVFYPRTVQPLVSRYTDWATRSTASLSNTFKMCH